MVLLGSELSEAEFADLARRWIDRNSAVAAKLRSLNHFDGKELVGGTRGDYTGMGIPYFYPGGTDPVTWRLRRYNPEIDARTQRPRQKYVAAQQDRNHIYFPVGTHIEEL